MRALRVREGSPDVAAIEKQTDGLVEHCRPNIANRGPGDCCRKLHGLPFQHRDTAFQISLGARWVTKALRGPRASQIAIGQEDDPVGSGIMSDGCIERLDGPPRLLPQHRFTLRVLHIRG